MKDLFTYFYDFGSQMGVVILVTLKQEVEQKSEWFCGVNFCSNFEVEWESGVWKETLFLASCFLLPCGISTLIFYLFNCSQKKFLAIILVLWSFKMRFPLFDFLLKNWI